MSEGWSTGAEGKYAREGGGIHCVTEKDAVTTTLHEQCLQALCRAASRGNLEKWENTSPFQLVHHLQDPVEHFSTPQKAFLWDLDTGFLRGGGGAHGPTQTTGAPATQLTENRLKGHTTHIQRVAQKPL
jgi:hypothetical protein